MALDRELSIYRQEILPHNGFYPFKQLIKGFCPKGSQADEHPLGAAQIHIRPDKRIFIPGKEHPPIFRTHIFQLPAKPQFIRHDPFQPK